MGKHSSWEYYGVRIIKQIVVDGEPDPQRLDGDYVPMQTQTFEESIMVVLAQSFRHAYNIAEKKSLKDQMSYENVYGQQVTWKYIDAVDCFIIYEQPKSGTEVYSCLHTTDLNTTADEFMDKWFHYDDGKIDGREIANPTISLRRRGGTR